MKPRKSTAAEVERRVETCELLLSRGGRKSQIHSAMKKEFGVSWQMASIYVSRARANLLKRLGKPKEQHRCESLALYESVIQSPDSKPNDRIHARQRIDELLGLDAPRQIEHGGMEGAAPIPVEATVTVLTPAEDKRMEELQRNRMLRELAGKVAPLLTKGINVEGNGKGNGSHKDPAGHSA
jgi:hypothetical protein